MARLDRGRGDVGGGLPRERRGAVEGVDVADDRVAHLRGRDVRGRLDVGVDRPGLGGRDVRVGVPGLRGLAGGADAAGALGFADARLGDLFFEMCCARSSCPGVRNWDALTDPGGALASCCGARAARAGVRSALRRGLRAADQWALMMRRAAGEVRSASTSRCAAVGERCLPRSTWMSLRSEPTSATACSPTTAAWTAAVTRGATPGSNVYFSTVERDSKRVTCWASVSRGPRIFSGNIAACGARGHMMRVTRAARSWRRRRSPARPRTARGGRARPVRLTATGHVGVRALLDLRRSVGGAVRRGA